MPKAVRYGEYGGIDVLQVVDVPQPEPGDGEVLVRVRAASINPGEGKIRQGYLHERWPATFPSGQGSDLAGTVERVGSGVDGFAAGDEVFGWVDTRSSQAEYAVVPFSQLVAKPANVSWEVAGSLFVAGTTAVATVRAVAPKPGERVAVSGAAGGVGSLAVQLARQTGAEVIGIAGPANHEWLAAHGVTPVAYGDRLADRLRAAGTVDAFIDTHGDGYVKLAIELGIAPDRIDTVADFAAIEQYGVKGEGSAFAANAATLTELADLAAKGELEVPIAATFPLAEAEAAYDAFAAGGKLGKIVLVM
jgi:NADPH:quinone reductase-like Zn-dependent oxidoreductase